jgi:hypothetical protein
MKTILDSSKGHDLKKSILIVAHPDDEILWYSSLLKNFDKIVICYLNVPSNAQLSQGRRQSLSEFPLDNIVCLGIDEAGVFNRAKWTEPETSPYGIKLSCQRKLEMKYIDNFHKLIAQLASELSNYQNVFTHNPWGEYGNEEHIQVYRAVKVLQKQYSFNIWFSNYCSNKSLVMMAKHALPFRSNLLTCKTNKVLSAKIKSLYQRNGCWTWIDEWTWVDDETFFKEPFATDKKLRMAPSVSINMIQLEVKETPIRKNKLLLEKMKNFLCKFRC